MSPTQLVLLTVLAMFAFAGNSLFCRLALQHTAIDPASFTSIRIIAGACALALIVRLRGAAKDVRGASGNWPSALALFAYAAAFSLAYVSLPAGMGALLLFGAVQTTMIAYGLWTGERFITRQTLGLVAALGGLLGLMLPGLSAPPLPAALLMLVAGVAWGIYSLRGKGGGDPTRVTAGNFLRAAALAAGLSVVMFPWASLDGAGVAYAVCSGALTSGVGYAVWYSAMRGLQATRAATVQLSVPVLAALGGVVFLGEALTQRLVLCSVAILGGVALVVIGKQRAS
jgi:drug/metabolite transporter (DMT)-like permease